MLDLLTVGPKFTRPACRAAAAAIDRYLLQTHARPQQQTHRPPLLLSTDGTDRQTDGRTLDRYMTFTAYYTDRVISLNINRFCVSSTSIYPSKAQPVVRQPPKLVECSVVCHQTFPWLRLSARSQRCPCEQYRTTTLRSKNVHLFIFLITLSKINRF